MSGTVFSRNLIPRKVIWKQQLSTSLNGTAVALKRMMFSGKMPWQPCI
jgi:hypothetical protein